MRLCPRPLPVATVLVLAAAGAGLGACDKTKFGGGKKTEPAPLAKETTPPGKPKVPAPGKPSPNEIDVGKVKNPAVECGGEHRALRMAIVVDTSLSMGSPQCGTTVKPGSTVEFSGSDPARTSASIRGKTECYTDRMNAAYHIITRTAERDQAAQKKNPTFNGSEIGLAHFPNPQSQESYAKISGEPPLSKQMTNLTGLTFDEAFKDKLWASLSRTQNSFGVTPYHAALSAGRDLLKGGRDPNDPRKDVLFLITDGAPTDQRPSQVLAMREEIKDVDVVYLYMFDPNVAEAARFEKAKSTLKDAFDKQGWARQPGNTDGYGPGDFEKYWQDLVRIPEKIATVRVDVTQPGELVGKIDALLDSAQACK